MTAPSLPETLARLAQLLPERVRAEMGEPDDVEPWVFRYEAKHRGWITVWWGGDMAAPHDLGALEMTLREECQARGWMWRVWAGLPGHGFGAEIERSVLTRRFEGYADTPAHALALALLSALRGEGT